MHTKKTGTQALVLGGGSVAGVAWELGMITGLREKGVDVREADLIIGTFESGGIAKSFKASRLEGSAGAEIRYTGGPGGLGTPSFPIEVGVLDATGAVGVGIVYQFHSVGGGYRQLNQQWAIQGTFSSNFFTWSLGNNGAESVAIQSNSGLEFQFGDDLLDGPPDPEKMSGCRLN